MKAAMAGGVIKTTVQLLGNTQSDSMLATGLGGSAQKPLASTFLGLIIPTSVTCPIMIAAAVNFSDLLCN